MEHTGVYTYQADGDPREMSGEQLEQYGIPLFFDKESAESAGYMPESIAVGLDHQPFYLDIYIESDINSTPKAGEFLVVLNFLDRVRFVYMEDLNALLSFIRSNHAFIELLSKATVSGAHS